MKINLRKISLRPIIGVYDWERKVRQEVLVNLEIEFENSGAVKSDDLNDTLDYEMLIRMLRERLETTGFYLIERLAGEIANIVMTESRVIKTTVEVIKPYALNGCEEVSVVYSTTR